MNFFEAWLAHKERAYAAEAKRINSSAIGGFTNYSRLIELSLEIKMLRDIIDEECTS